LEKTKKIGAAVKGEKGGVISENTFKWGGKKGVTSTSRKSKSWEKALKGGQKIGLSMPRSFGYQPVTER